ncbi:hypothetical protein [Aureliella helgolandensis]|uniref:ADP-ribosylation factor-directed GTPase activating protein n=1 Tax=Aureliella helgolandensis TaxID=2527968 RepID=A0A518GCJ1_9BACT|nr:hypothetical protein [Aureliella helgolandensis]QDV26316.1 hypothetical protein Q31a_46880 [Aureliella helgolandensis]
MKFTSNHSTYRIAASSLVLAAVLTPFTCGDAANGATDTAPAGSGVTIRLTLAPNAAAPNAAVPQAVPENPPKTPPATAAAEEKQTALVTPKVIPPSATVPAKTSELQLGLNVAQASSDGDEPQKSVRASVAASSDLEDPTIPMVAPYADSQSSDSMADSDSSGNAVHGDKEHGIAVSTRGQRPVRALPQEESPGLAKQGVQRFQLIGHPRSPGDRIIPSASNRFNANRNSRPTATASKATSTPMLSTPRATVATKTPAATTFELDNSLHASAPLELSGNSSYDSQEALTFDDADSLEFSHAFAEEEATGTAECPGSPEGDALATGPQPDDIPLEQEEHPYDAPAAESSAEPIAEIIQAPNSFTTRELEIRRGINHCLNYFLTHPENVVRRGPWALMHATLPFGVEAEIVAGNRRVNAIGWMCYNGVCAKQRMFQPTRTGFRTNLGPGVQGHEGQFLAILAQSKVSIDYPLQIGSRNYTIADLVKYEMATCREKSELTFKLIGLSHYLPADQQWRDNRGQTWSLEKMVAEELAQPVIGAACGGSHRLMGLSYAVIRRQQAGFPIDGHWYRAEQYLNDYVQYAFTLQNPDGSFSTEWFEGRGAEANVERKMQTTGHILEWLIYTLPTESLRSPQIQLSVEYLLRTVGADPAHDWAIGPRGHALRALALYQQRVFNAEPGQMARFVAQTETHPAVRR